MALLDTRSRDSPAIERVHPDIRNVELVRPDAEQEVGADLTDLEALGRLQRAQELALRRNWPLRSKTEKRRRPSHAAIESPRYGYAATRRWNSPGPPPCLPNDPRNVPPASKNLTSADRTSATTNPPSGTGHTPAMVVN